MRWHPCPQSHESPSLACAYTASRYSHCGGVAIYFDTRGSPQCAPLPNDSKTRDLRSQYPENTSGTSTDRCVLISFNKPQVTHDEVAKVDDFVTVRPFSNNVQNSSDILLSAIGWHAPVRPMCSCRYVGLLQSEGRLLTCLRSRVRIFRSCRGTNSLLLVPLVVHPLSSIAIQNNSLPWCASVSLVVWSLWYDPPSVQQRCRTHRNCMRLRCYACTAERLLMSPI
jgi:hypothetical protein